MKKLIVSLLLGSLAVPAVASIDIASDFNPGFDLSSFDGILLADAKDTGFDLSGLPPADENKKDGDKGGNKKAAAPVRSGPPRTAFFTGIEMEEFHYDNMDKTSNIIKIIADGGTQITPNLRMMYVISEAERYRGKDNDFDRRRLNTVIQPRYIRRINNNINTFVGFLFKRHIEDNGFEELVYMVKPGGNIRKGKHSFRGFTEILYKVNSNRDSDNQRVKQYSTGTITEVEYTYRYSPKLNFGFESVISRQNNALNFHNTNIMPYFSYNWSNGLRQQWSWRRGKDGNDNDMGWRYTNWQVNNNYPLTNNVNMIANIGWRRGKQYGTLNDSKREGMFLKAGLGIRF